jgi:hypothetical protein
VIRLWSFSGEMLGQVKDNIEVSFKSAINFNKFQACLNSARLESIYGSVFSIVSNSKLHCRSETLNQDTLSTKYNFTELRNNTINNDSMMSFNLLGDNNTSRLDSTSFDPTNLLYNVRKAAETSKLKTSISNTNWESKVGILFYFSHL